MLLQPSLRVVVATFSGQRVKTPGLGRIHRHALSGLMALREIVRGIGGAILRSLLEKRRDAFIHAHQRLGVPLFLGEVDGREFFVPFLLHLGRSNGIDFHYNWRGSRGLFDHHRRRRVNHCRPPVRTTPKDEPTRGVSGKLKDKKGSKETGSSRGKAQSTHGNERREFEPVHAPPNRTRTGNGLVTLKG